MEKKRIVKDYEKLPEDVLTRLKLEYPYGFEDNLVSFRDKDGNKVSALPFETEDIYYLVRMTIKEARQFVEEDDDYDSEGNLKDEFVVAETTDEDEFEGEDEEDEDDL